MSVATGRLLIAKSTGFFGGIAGGAVTTTMAVGGGVTGMAANALGDANLRMSQGMGRAGTNSGYFADIVSGKS